MVVVTTSKTKRNVLIASAGIALAGVGFSNDFADALPYVSSTAVIIVFFASVAAFPAAFLLEQISLIAARGLASWLKRPVRRDVESSLLRNGARSAKWIAFSFGAIGIGALIRTLCRGDLSWFVGSIFLAFAIGYLAGIGTTFWLANRERSPKRQHRLNLFRHRWLACDLLPVLR